MRIAVVGAQLGKATAIRHYGILMKADRASDQRAPRHGTVRDHEDVLASVAQRYDTAVPRGASVCCATTVCQTTTRGGDRCVDILEELDIEPIMTRSTVALLDKVAVGIERGAGGRRAIAATAIELLQDYHGGKRSREIAGSFGGNHR
jgi:hypothetical protein